MTRIGEILAIVAAFVWSANSAITEKKGRGLDAGAINFGRLVIGLIVTTLALTLFPAFFGKLPIPADGWWPLLLSGVIGFSIGDTFLFSAFLTIGSRLTMLLYAFSPVLTAVMAYFIFGEKLTPFNLLGIVLVLTGILLVVLQRKPDGTRKVSPRGILFGFLAAVGQAGGAILSKLGLQSVDPLTGTQLRVIGGILGMLVIITLLRKWPSARNTFSHPNGKLVILISGVFGTFLGVTLSMWALKYAKAAVASTLLALTPITILPISAFFLKEKLTAVDILGAVISVAGCAILFL
ncbi:MAG TPA: DMT family transporter [Bellilinea sp.]|nr:DMT family transporter [Bellilinea sp.]